MARAFSVTASGQVFTTDAELVGWTVTETSGSAAADVSIHEGDSTSGNKVARVRVASGDSKTVDVGHPIYCRDGVYVELTTGAAEVIAYVR